MEEKILKRWLKRKVKITEALLVGFLITGGIMHGQDLGETNDRDITVEYTFDHRPTEDEENEMAAAWPVLPSGVNSFTNNGNIKTSYTETDIVETDDTTWRENKGNGVNLEGSGQNITNKGIIRGYTNITGGTSKVNVRNTSLIEIYGYGYAYGKTMGSGNGMGSYGRDNNVDIGDMTNSGTIHGYAKTMGGSAETSVSGDSDQMRYSKAFGYSYGYGKAIGSGNGMGSYGDNSRNIGTITNSGIVRGYAETRGGDAVTNTVGNMIGPGSNYYYGSAYAYAVASGEAMGSGNGVGSYSDNGNSGIGTIINSGTMYGYTQVKGGTATTNGVSIVSGEAFSYAQGKTTGSGNGVGSYSGNDSSNIGTITNSGIISGNIDIDRGTAKAEASGDNTYTSDTTTDVSTEALGSGNGISSYNNNDDIHSENDSSIGDIINNGTISGYAKVGREVSELIENWDADSSSYVTSHATAHATAKGIGNGISSYSTNNSGSIENITNTGDITGYAQVRGGSATAGASFVGQAFSFGTAIGTGNGISSYSANNSSNIGNIINSGITSGYVEVAGGKAIGIDSNFGHNIATASASALGSGNGISSYNSTGDSKIGNIINSGTISGYASLIPGKFRKNGMTEAKTDYARLSFSGNGIGMNDEITEPITNSGVLKGSQSAIAATAINSVINNYGTMAGRKIYSDGEELKKNGNADETIRKKVLQSLTPATENNLGIYVNLRDIFATATKGDFVGRIDGDDRYAFISSVDIGSGGTASIISPNGNETTMTIINADDSGDIAEAYTIYNSDETTSVDTYLNISNLVARENLIINGVGQNQGALVIEGENQEIELSNSTLNGYNTALYVKDGNSFTGTDVIFNGGGLKNDVAVIHGGTEENLAGMNVSLKGNSITNGTVDMGSGEHDMLSLANTTQVNGDLDGGAGNTDILNLGDGGTGELRILHDIRNFEKINSHGDVTIFETSHIDGTGTLEVKSGNLVLRIDPTLVNGDGEVTGHALYDNSGNLNLISTGGDLKIGLNGTRKGTIIHLGNNFMDEKIDSIYDEDDRLRTNNVLLDAIIHDPGTNQKVIIDSVNYLPKPTPTPPVPPTPDTPDTVVPSEPHNYEIMNDIYLSALSVEEEEKLGAESDDDSYALSEIYSLLDQIYANNPYGYSFQAARDNMILFEDAVSYFTIKPNLHEWIFQGKALYSHRENENEGTRRYKIKSNATGGLASAEYGLTQDTSVGIVMGGLHEKADFRNSSRYEGDSFYTSAFLKHDRNRFKFWTGVGYLYTSAKGKRNIRNDFHSYRASDTYDVNSFDLFGEIRYIPEPVYGWSVEPRAKISLYYSSQGSVDEKYSAETFSLGVKKEKVTTGRLELAGDIRKDFTFASAEMRNRLSLGTGILLGKHRKDVTGYIVGASGNGTDFAIRGTDIPSVTGKVGYSLEYERTNGIIGTLSASYEFGGDYKNFETSIGLGYRF